MEPQPGSPASSPSSSPGSTKVKTTPSDEPITEEVIIAQEPADRKSTSSSSSSSSSSSDSSAESLRHVDVIELGVELLPAPEYDEPAVASPPVHNAGDKPDDWAMPEDEKAAAASVPLERGAEVEPDDDRASPVDEHAAAVHSAEVKPDDWAATWPEPPPPPSVDDSFSSDTSAGAAAGPTTEAPQIQTMSKPEVAGGEFDPQRIPASVFQPTRTSLSQAEWSMASNESLFSIQGASDVGGPYATSRSHFDFFYDEAMAAAETDASKLPTVAEGTEPGELAVDSSKEFAAPGSASSRASNGSPGDKKSAAVFRRDESGSGGSSSNFSFAFPILAPTSPKKRDLISSALYQPLEKEYEQPATQLEPPVSAFVEMTTEAELRGSTGCCCCGCCWFDCSWATCCGWWRCCRSCCCCRCCSCPSFCLCSWCLCS
nr:unnamed protein product [Digitaria exilis]